MASLEIPMSRSLGQIISREVKYHKRRGLSKALWDLEEFQNTKNYDQLFNLQSPGAMFPRRLVAEKESDVDAADEDDVALAGHCLRIRPSEPDLKKGLGYDRGGHHHVEVGESGIFSLDIP